MDKRASLIERRPVERDAELDRHGGQAFFQHRAVAIERRDIAPPRCKIDGAIELIEDRFDDVVIDLHPVRGHVVAADAIEIPPSHRVDRQSEPSRDRFDDRLDGEHALGAAVAAKGGVGHRVGLAGQAAEADVRQVIAIVRVT